MFDTLAGVRVVELSCSVLGAASGKILADHGAEVIVVEPPEGSCLRRQPEFYDFWQNGKKSVMLSLDEMGGRDGLDRLLGGADVFLTDLGSRSREKWNLEEAVLRKHWPSLICVSAETLGGGRDKNDPVEDVSAFWAKSGYLRDFAEQGTILQPEHHVGAGVLAQSLYLGIAAALLERETTGKGCGVSASLYGNAIYGTHYQISAVQNGKELPVSRRQPLEAMANTYPCKDGWIVFYDNQFDRHFWKMMKAIGLGHLEGDPRWTCRADTMGAKAPELIAILDEAFSKLTQDEAVAALRSVDIAVEKAWRSQELVHETQAQANGYLAEGCITAGKHTGAKVQMPVLPVSIDGRFCDEALSGGPKLGGAMHWSAKR